MEEKWYVVYTKSRGEKKVAEQLNALGVKAYCPVKTEMRVWSDRKKKVVVPLLPSMILVKLPEQDRDRVFAVSGVVRYMFWGGKPVVVREHEVEVLKEVEQNNGMELNAVEAIGPGTQLELSNFGFEDQSGEVKHVSGNQCWVVLKDLGYVVKLQLQ
ncbi:UpxY family transcription antiterminator [Formosa sp. A9]|uniref:UpxY family transcription antiterminator n=1 Tax=Formosa sp. A9 TaxID=3442641 RepID=UPI003EC0B3E2